MSGRLWRDGLTRAVQGTKDRKFQMQSRAQTENRPTPPKRRATAESRREELIEAAIIVIGKKGLANTTLADVATQAGLSYGNVTFRFKTKSALLLAALTRVTHEYVDHRQTATDLPDATPAERLEAMISASFDRKVASKRKIALWHSFLSECHLHASYRKLFAELQEKEYGLTETICAALLKEEGRESEDLHLITLAVSSLIEGLWFNLRLASSAVNREEARDAARMVLSALFPTSFGRFARSQNPAEGPTLG